MSNQIALKINASLAFTRIISGRFDIKFFEGKCPRKIDELPDYMFKQFGYWNNAKMGKFGELMCGTGMHIFTPEFPNKSFCRFYKNGICIEQFMLNFGGYV